MDHVILHSDMNNFYASVESLYNPAFREKPMAVVGDPKSRHGIVLAKNYHAKQYGIQTGDPIWMARQKCPDIIFSEPHYDRYIHFSQMAREIYEEYTDQVESFGLDECWLDVTGVQDLFGSGKQIADTIRERVKFELGLTASVGVSYNKIFAKLGSDLHKPDATTVIGRDFREKIWYLPADMLLYVGRATYEKLRSRGIKTIGDLAQTDPSYLEQLLGKNGLMLWAFANGLDTLPVSPTGTRRILKTIGNSTTAPRDLITEDDIKITLYILAESVAERMRREQFCCKGVQIMIRDNQLTSFERQGRLQSPTCTSQDIFYKAHELFNRNKPENPVRSLGVRAIQLITREYQQLSFLEESVKRQKQEDLERAVDNIRSRFGHFSVQRGIMLLDPILSRLDPVAEHTIYPEAFLKSKT
ncbi:DNA polymerase IV [Blautia producta]|uniref:DNA polymerase IV n=1 Tax=Blautia producta TaxID=33035 RepID=UPI001D006259|nr:DNA polymerase IV [Blautia producta]MCB5873915.1 DNA polymerase IV [Blautia producta]